MPSERESQTGSAMQSRPGPAVINGHDPMLEDVIAVVTGRRLLRLRAVMESVGLGRSTIYRRMAAGTFPKCVDNGSGVRWREDEIEAWKVALPYRGNRCNHTS